MGLTQLPQIGVSAWVQTINEGGSSVANWTSESGTWITTGGVIQATNAGNLRYTTKQVTPVAVVEFEARQVSGSGANQIFGVVFGGAGGHTFRINTQDQVSWLLQLERTAQQGVYSAAVSGMAVNTWKTYRIVQAGSSITAYIDGVLQGTAALAALDDEMSDFKLMTFGTIVAQYRNIKLWRPILPWE